MRFTSHRDFARALERAILRARVPIAYSQGFSPHPKISYASAAPTGVASEAEYLEMGLREKVRPEEFLYQLDAALPLGLDVLDVVEAQTKGWADRLESSIWRVDLPGLTVDCVTGVMSLFLSAERVLVERTTKTGSRWVDVRGPVRRMSVKTEAVVQPFEVGGLPYAILDLVVRHVTPTVRPDDILTGLRVVADLELSEPPRATRLAQGVFTADGWIVDPLAADRDVVGIEASSE